MFDVFFLFAKSITNSLSLQSNLLAVMITSLANHSRRWFRDHLLHKNLLLVLLDDLLKQGLSNQNHFTIFHLPVLTTVLDHSQVVSSHRNGDSRTNVSQLGTLKHMLCLYPRHKQGQPTTLLSRGPGPRPNLDFKPPLLSPGLSTVLRPPPSPSPISRSG